MCRKLILLVSFVFLLSLVGEVSAQLPGQWSQRTIGGDAPAGSAEYDAATDTWTVIGDGHDIWDNADDFHFVYQQLEGDGEITARVTSVGTGSSSWSKVGVMIRETLDEGSKWAMQAVTSATGADDGGGLAFQWRTTTNGGCGWSDIWTPAILASDLPYWVRVTRTGDLFEGFHSPDGNTWTKETDITISMANQVYIGLARTSHTTGELRSATIDNVSYVGNIHGQIKAWNPSPADNATHPQAYVSLQWSAGATAVSHDVYLGTSYADVEAGTADTFRGNLPLGTRYFIAGFAGRPYPEGLVGGTDYYWRIDEVEAGGTKQTGDVWTFFVPPTKAYSPSPADGAAFVPVDATLGWTAGFGAIEHHVYFGDNPDDVAAGTPDTDKGTVGAASFGPPALEYQKTYYWRVDEFDGWAMHTGDVWSFTTTIPGLGTIVSERWDGINGDALNVLKDYWKYPNDPDVTEVVTEFAWNGPDLDNYGGRIYGWLYVPATGDYTFWLCSDNQGELWLSTNDDPDNIELIAQESSWTDPGIWGTGEQQSNPIPLQGGERYYVEALWKEGTGGDQCQVAWEGPGVPGPTIIPGSNLSPYLPVKAYGPNPANNSTGAKQTGTLQWKPGIHAASHQVYFGTDEDAVRNATTASIEYKATRALGSEIFEAGELEWESTYYWRIDEVNNLHPDSPWVGGVWTFTTASYAIVDDFEDYGGDEVPVQEQIWYAWRDGVGYGAIGAPPYYPGNGTGAEVGDVGTLSYTEETTVHGGRQAMPYWFNNNKQGYFKYSEAAKTLTGGLRNWTAEGVKALSLWFQGYPASTGSFVEAPAGTYTINGSGTDIWDVGPGAGEYGDEFHYAYKTLTGAGTIIAKVDSVAATHDWAKAGVMIRETLEPGSKHAFACVTPASGVSSQGRPDVGAASFSTTQAGITAPHWVRLERDLSGNFTVSHSANGSTWEPVTNATPQSIQMNSLVYVGLAVTSHDAALTCEAVFSNVTITGNVGTVWAHQDIGILSNAAEPMYVAIANSTGQPAVVYHDNPNATQIDTWTEWNIDLKDFADKGINLADVNSIAIGFGNRNNPTAGGAGKMYFDDIRLYRPRFIPELVTFSQADLSRNGAVDFADIEVMAADWLNQGGSGVWYEYGEGSWSLLPDFDRVTTAKQGVINNFDITVRNQNDNFGFRFTGKINIGAAGAYTFYTTSDDGSQLFIDGALLVDNDGTHGMVEQSGVVTLTAGLHDIAVTMFELGGGEGLDVEYEGPGITRGPIPDDVLTLPAPVSDLNQDGVVDFKDYAVLLDEWGQETLWPEW